MNFLKNIFAIQPEENSIDILGFFFLLFSVFAVYLASSAPWLAPYRDMGEMTAATQTLGIIHPPGYPLYTLSAHIFKQIISLGTSGYQTNLFSVAVGALACGSFFILMRRLEVPFFIALSIAWLWAFSKSVWTVSRVAEMYSANLLCSIFLIGLWLNRAINVEKKIVAVSFLLGLFTGLRLELVLLIPAIFVSGCLDLYKSKKLSCLGPLVLLSTFFFTLGFSIFLYMPIRSAQKPELNWKRPDTLHRLYESLVRKSHGGTLDLISENYKPGELFSTNMKLYGRDIAQESWGLCLFAFWGLFIFYKRERSIFAFFLTGWFFTGVYFIYKANIPPNAHAYAILKPHFLLPDIFIYLLSAIGLGAVLSQTRVQIVLFLMVLTAPLVRWSNLSRRDHFFTYDYAQNIFRSLPQDSVLVMKKDVQLFTFWAAQIAERWRPDLEVVAKGLSGSDWYHEMRADFNSPLTFWPLRSQTDWERFVLTNQQRQIFSGFDDPVPEDSIFKHTPRGVILRIHHPDDFAIAWNLFRNFYVYRNKYSYATAPDFFTADLLDDYSKGMFYLSMKELDNKNFSNAVRGFSHSIAWNPTNPDAYSRRGYIYFVQNEFQSALKDFVWANWCYAQTIQLAEDYFSLPELINEIKKNWANNYNNIGVVKEKLGDLAAARSAYQKGIEVFPTAQAHFNLAVLAWGKNWDEAAQQFSQCLRLDPNNVPAQHYLAKAQSYLNPRGLHE